MLGIVAVIPGLIQGVLAGIKAIEEIHSAKSAVSAVPALVASVQNTTAAIESIKAEATATGEWSTEMDAQYDLLLLAKINSPAWTENAVIPVTPPSFPATDSPPVG